MPDHQPPTEPFLERDEQAERVRWFYSSRVDAEGKVPQGLIARASAQRRNMARRMALEAPGGPGSVNWTPLGPSVVASGQASGRPPVNGRFTALAVGPGGSRIYAGAANGGVWFSLDGGMNWAPLDDYSTSPGFSSGMDADSLSVGAIVVQFGADAAGTGDVIFVGTGEPQARFEPAPGFPSGGDGYFGVGVRFSARGGAPGSWSREATNLAGHGFFKIIIDPDDSTRVYAATSHGLYQRPTGGSFTTWNQVKAAFINVHGAASDIIVVGTSTNKRYYAAFWGDQVYSSPDGNIWKALGGIKGAGRIVLAAGENDPTVIYALGDNGSLYRLDRGTGGSFQLVGGVPRALFFGNQGYYDIVLAVDPTDANTVYLGGDITLDQGEWNLSFYKGTITGGPGTYTFPFNSANDIFTNPATKRPDSSRVPLDPSWIGRGIHPDIHAIAFATNLNGTHDGKIVWVGTDGGLFRSTAGGRRDSFTARNTGMAVVEMTYIAQRADTDAVLFAGCQDNGTLRYWGEQAWYEAPEADGGGVALDPNNPYGVMRQYTKANLSKSTDGGASGNWIPLNFPPKTSNTFEQKTAAENEDKSTNFYSPLAVSFPGVHQTLAAFGTNRLWLTSDWGNTWVTLPTGTNPYAAAAPNDQQDVLDGTPIRAIAFIIANPDPGGLQVIFAATQHQVWVFQESSFHWIINPLPTTGLPANHIITALACLYLQASPQNISYIYITLGGSGIDHVWYWDGDNSMWQSANLTADGKRLDVPAHAVVTDPLHPENLYVGTDVGCWKGTRTVNTSTGTLDFTWSLFSQGLPESAITDLAIHTPSRLLRAATHGRGVWEIPLDATSGEDPDIYIRLNYADSGRLGQIFKPTGWEHHFDWVKEALDDPTAPGFKLSLMMSPDIKVRRGSLAARLPPLSTPPNYLDFATSIGVARDPISNLQTADRSGINQVFIQVHNRGLTPVRGQQVWVLLLIGPSAASLPDQLGKHMQERDPHPVWLGNAWAFADATTPYRFLPDTLDVRTPQVVEYQIDFSTTGLNQVGKQICLAAFVTSTIPGEGMGEPLVDQQLRWDRIMYSKYFAAQWIVLV